ncbi:Kelch-like protein 21 [Branchiostoma belcheri]|nr:Kelch-like protein 21 [Branchiostoma belcheri]KAI8485645.1 Kelch-like protein 21 [Branchiostoma belcheri]
MGDPNMTMQPPMVYNDFHHADKMLQGLTRLREQGRFYDVVICVGKEEIPCHRVVLAAASSYFDSSISNDLGSSSMLRLELPWDIRLDIVRVLIDFAYTGQITITDNNARNLLFAASAFGFHSVRAACSEYLQQQLTTCNCISLHDLSEQYTCPELAQQAKAFILQHFASLCGADSSEFLQVSKDRLVEYISSDEVNVTKEEIVYEAVIMWVKQELSVREASLHDLLRHVRLPFLNPRYLVSRVATEPIISRSAECMKLVQEARQYQVFDYDRFDMPSPRFRPRPSSRIQEVLVVVGSDYHSALTNVDCYSPMDETWTSLASLPETLRGDFPLAVLGNDIYVVGDPAGSTDTWRYNSQSDKWVQVAGMPRSHGQCSSSVLHGQIYAVGGDDSGTPLADVDRYDPLTNFWEELQPMPKALNDFVTAACGGKLFVFGCSSNWSEAETPELQQYDPDLEEWKVLHCPSMPHWDDVPQAVTLNGRIYFIQTNSNKVDVYAPPMNKFSQLAPMNHLHHEGSIVVWQDRLHAIGGTDGSDTFTEEVEAYDVNTDAWNIVAKLSDPKRVPWCASIFLRLSGN